MGYKKVKDISIHPDNDPTIKSNIKQIQTYNLEQGLPRLEEARRRLGIIIDNQKLDFKIL